MSRIDTVGGYFFKLEWKFRKNFIGQNVKRNSIMPDSQFLKTSVYVFAIHNRLNPYIIFFIDAMQKNQYSIIPAFHYSKCE